MTPLAAIWEIDLHGKSVYQARVAIDSALRKADGGVYRLRLIHGYFHGSALKELAEAYAAHPKVRALRSINPGCTDLILRE